MEVAYSGEIIPYGKSVIYTDDMLYLRLEDVWKLYRYHNGGLQSIETVGPFVYRNILTDITYTVESECIDRFDGCGLYLDYTGRSIYRIDSGRWCKIADLASPEIDVIDGYSECKLYLKLGKVYRYKDGILQPIDTSGRFLFRDDSTGITYIIDDKCIERFDGDGVYLDYTSGALYLIGVETWTKIMDLAPSTIGPIAYHGRSARPTGMRRTGCI